MKPKKEPKAECKGKKLTTTKLPKSALQRASVKIWGVPGLSR
jgi:hypothetical protein